jgi:hypothetical protein
VANSALALARQAPPQRPELEPSCGQSAAPGWNIGGRSEHHGQSLGREQGEIPVVGQEAEKGEPFIRGSRLATT